MCLDVQLTSPVSLPEDLHYSSILAGTCIPMHSVCHGAAAGHVSVISLLKLAYLAIALQLVSKSTQSQCHSNCTPCSLACHSMPSIDPVVSHNPKVADQHEHRRKTHQQSTIVPGPLEYAIPCRDSFTHAYPTIGMKRRPPAIVRGSASSAMALGMSGTCSLAPRCTVWLSGP